MIQAEYPFWMNSLKELESFPIKGDACLCFPGFRRFRSWMRLLDEEVIEKWVTSAQLKEIGLPCVYRLAQLSQLLNSFVNLLQGPDVNVLLHDKHMWVESPGGEANTQCESNNPTKWLYY
jgi:hypothetical protein